VNIICHLFITLRCVPDVSFELQTQNFGLPTVGCFYDTIPSMLHVGLTGNIATGKSYASMRFAELGAHVIDADRIAHELLVCNSKIFKKIVGSFGEEILSQDGSIDRKALGKIVFFDPEKRLLLNSLTHSEIGAEILRRILELEQISEKGIVIVEAALMVESGSYEKYHRLIVVTCDPVLQISRLVGRDALTQEEAKARIRSQMPMEEKLKLADYRIDTSGTIKQTHQRVDAIYRDLLSQEIHLREQAD
jgi:dephospho-CoA kinase